MAQKRDAKKGGKKKFQRKRHCRLCEDKVTKVDYKDLTILKKNVTNRGKIRARRTSGNCEKHQRMIARALKRARHLAMIPYKLEYFRK